jgi:soluble lytic murein transglycosylase-like protein
MPEYKFNIMPLFVSIFFLAESLLITRINSEITKKTNSDGTVEYFNSEKSVMTKPFKKHEFNSPYIDLIEEISLQEGVDPYLVKCLIKIESNFNPDAVSVAGAMGLMQIMQDIARQYNVADPLSPEENLNAGIRHLKTLLNYFKNDVSLSLAAYHAGLGRVKKNMDIPPIKSTIEYVKNVMMLYAGNKGNAENSVKKLYKRINSEGVIEIYSR